MSKEERIKILILGPSQAGKSNIANYLSGTRETPTLNYKETCPLRVFEVGLEGLNVGGGQRRPGRGVRATAELWDVSGNSRFQACWPAIAKDTHGIIFVFNPAVKNQEKELELWYKSFAAPQQIPDEHCIIFAHRSQPAEEGAQIPRVSGSLSRIPKTLETSLDFHPESFKEAFDRLVEKILATRREQEENRVLRDEGMSGPLLVGASQ